MNIKSLQMGDLIVSHSEIERVEVQVLAVALAGFDAALGGDVIGFIAAASELDDRGWDLFGFHAAHAKRPQRHLDVLTWAWFAKKYDFVEDIGKRVLLRDHLPGVYFPGGIPDLLAKESEGSKPHEVLSDLWRLLMQSMCRLQGLDSVLLKRPMLTGGAGRADAILLRVCAEHTAKLEAKALQSTVPKGRTKKAARARRL